MAKKKPNKSAKVRSYMAKHPGAKPADIAKAVGVPRSLVYNVRASVKNKRRKPGRPKATRGRTAAKNGNGGQSEQIILAATLVKTCGGLEEARKMLDAVEEVAGLLGSAKQ